MSSEVKRYYISMAGNLVCLKEMTPEYAAETGFVGLIKGEDYAALEAELERRKQLDQEALEFRQELIRERDEARAQLAAIQGGMGEQWKDHMTAELVGKLTECASVYGKTQQLRERLRGIILPVIAQHQRITAAMAAEVERLQFDVATLIDSKNGLVEECNGLHDENAELRHERDALRAELAEVKGREAVAEGPSGYDQLWQWFGLSYAAWLTLPRVLMHAMPDEWQRKMAELLNEWDDSWRTWHLPAPEVTAKANGKYTAWPEWLLNYRHPDQGAIKAVRSTLRQAQENKP